MPPGRKKFISEASTKGYGEVGVPPGLQPLTVKGLAGASSALRPARRSKQLRKLATIRSPRTAVGVDGAVQMASAIEVVGETEGEAAAQVAFQREVRLLRVGVHEILGLRIAEGLEGQRQEGPLATFR